MRDSRQSTRLWHSHQSCQSLVIVAELLFRARWGDVCPEPPVCLPALCGCTTLEAKNKILTGKQIVPLLFHNALPVAILGPVV